MSLSQYVGLFAAESREHIATINRHLLALEAEPRAREAVEGIFRSVHTIKGMSATLGFGSVADLAHELESVLDPVRSGRTEADEPLIDLLFAAVDALAIAVDDAVTERESNPNVEETVERLRAYAIDRRGSEDSAPEADRLVGGGSVTDAVTAAAEPSVRAYRVSAMIAANASLPGVRAYLLLQKAKQLGAVGELSPSEADLQAGIAFDGRVSFRLRATGSALEVRERLGSVGELASLAVEAVDATRSTPNVQERLPATAVRMPGSASRDLNRHVRIDADRLDALMDQVGELVVLRDRLQRVARVHGGEDLLEPVDLAARLIGEVRDEVMRIRMIPISEVIERFPRLVRDAARSLGKRVELMVSGTEIEVDRSLLGRLGDPLVHLLRNAVDHGIESPAERAAAGKPEAGVVRIEAERERSRVVLRVSDDGRGIDRDEVLRKAIERSIVTEGVADGMSDEEILALVTRPGFSTATEVTDVSGRGVGLDVVATEIRALGGTVTIESVAGEGTTFVLRLPVTVGILRAVLVGVGDGSFGIPVAHVAETVEFRLDEVYESAGQRVVFFRGEPLPLVCLRDRLGMPYTPRSEDTIPVVLVELADELAGIEVDSLLGQQEIVIKPFDATHDTLPCFSGATILADGRPALILDVSSVLRQGRAGAALLSPVPVSS